MAHLLRQVVYPFGFPPSERVVILHRICRITLDFLLGVGDQAHDFSSRNVMNIP